MQAQCPRCGGEMNVEIRPRAIRPAWKWILCAVVLAVLVGLAYRFGVWTVLEGAGNAIAGILMLLTVISCLVTFWEPIQAALTPPDWNGVAARRALDRKRLEWERKRRQIEEMMEKDPTRVSMYCNRCGRLA
jgi:hypothetical protein